MAASEGSVRELIQLKLEEQSVRECAQYRWGRSPRSDSVLVVGSSDWFDSHVPGVIGMHGNEPGAGPGVVLLDIDRNSTELLWTSGLTGCMGLAIIGYNENGTRDAFFCHARQYDSPTALEEPQNPMAVAKKFVERHPRVRVIWGTDFSFALKNPSEALVARQKAQAFLSRQLGCWVRESDRVICSDWTFCPKLEKVFPEKPAAAFELMSKRTLNAVALLDADLLFSRGRAVACFHPDDKCLGELRLQRERVKAQRLQFSKQEMKVIVLNMALEAYYCGNFDVLSHLARSAQAGTPPLADKDSVSAWAPFGKSETARVVLQAFESVVVLTRRMDPTGAGCGLYESGREMYKADEYQRELAENSTMKTAAAAAAASSDPDPSLDDHMRP